MGNCKDCSKTPFVWGTTPEAIESAEEAQAKASAQLRVAMGAPLAVRAVVSSYGLDPDEVIETYMDEVGDPAMNFLTPKDWTDEQIMEFYAKVEKAIEGIGGQPA